MSETIDPDTEVSPEEVAKFLREQPGKVETGAAAPEADPSEPAVIAEIPPEILEQMQAQHIPSESDDFVVDENPLLSSNLATASRAIWKRDFDDTGEVDVTPLERDLYFKATLTGEAVVFDLSVSLETDTMLAETAVRCRTLNNFELDAINRAVVLENVEAGGMLTGAQQNSRMQAFAVLMHILRIDDVETNPLLAFPGPKFPPLDTAAALIIAYHKAGYSGMQTARYHLLLHVVRQFEKKIIMCQEAFKKRNFLSRAGTV